MQATAKRKRKKTKQRSGAQVAAEPTEQAPEAQLETEESSVNELEQPEATYAFPSKSRCPRCKSTNTLRKTDRGRVQYRQCQRPICRRRYKEIGWPI